VIRVQNGLVYWWILLSKTNTHRVVQLGSARSYEIVDIPLRGDFDGDGKADIAIYRRNLLSRLNLFVILRSSDGKQETQKFGRYLDNTTPITGDFDGDGKTDVAYTHFVLEPSERTWYWRQSSDGVDMTKSFGSVEGNVGGISHGDYDGDGKTDLAVWRRIQHAQCFFIVYRSRDGLLVVAWGYGAGENNVNDLIQTEF